MKLIVGLGNPGRDYVETRHNIGFAVVDALAEKLGWVKPGQFDRMARSAFDGLALDSIIQLTSGGSEKLILLKPMTYMNVSGRSIRSALDFFKITPEEILVIVDEINLPVGKIRLRGEGSDGGHNGLKSIQQMLGTPKYPRLRIGVGSPPPPIAGKDWVLGKFRPDEQPQIQSAIDRAASCAVVWADNGLTKAMNTFNAEDEPKSDSKTSPRLDNEPKK